MDYLIEDRAAVRAELGARRKKIAEMARIIGVNARTLRKQLKGEHPLTAENASKLLAALDDLGPWHRESNRDALVILACRPTVDELVKRRGTGISTMDREVSGQVPPAATPLIPFDTLQLTIEVSPEHRDAVLGVIESQPDRGPAPDIGARCKHRCKLIKIGPCGPRPSTAMIVAWDPYGSGRAWLTAQLSPWCDEHRAFLRKLIGAAGYPAQHDEPWRGIMLKRLDLFVDFQVPLKSLLLTRLGARTYRAVQNKNGDVTLYVGSRRSKVFARQYDLVRKHDLQVEHDITRFELQLNPSPHIDFDSSELDAFILDAVQNITVHTVHLPDATVVDLALLDLARTRGAAWMRRELRKESRAKERDFNQLLTRAAVASPITDPVAYWERTWSLGIHLLRQALLSSGPKPDTLPPYRPMSPEQLSSALAELSSDHGVDVATPSIRTPPPPPPPIPPLAPAQRTHVQETSTNPSKELSPNAQPISPTSRGALAEGRRFPSRG